MRNTYLQQCDYGSRFRILKGGKISLVVSAFIASVTLLQAAPTGGVVTSGTATIAQTGSVTNITQSTQKAAINWQNFSIGATETVNFNQPNASAITLNRVVGNEKSIIDGALNANGQVFILNSNGLLFSKNASINTAGLVATTMNLSDADFNAGNYAFKGDSSASIINQGTINISDKGYAALFGKEVINEGIIKATLGKVELVGAKEVTLNLNGNSLVNLTVNKGVLDALVENKGAIYADGGEVYLTTNTVNELLKGVVNNTGVVEANSIDDITGKIILFAHGGTANVSGTLEAKEGFIETSGETLHVSENTRIKAKEWLIDPVNITIESSGSTADLASSSIKASFIESTLNGGTGVTLTATNDININEALAWNQSLLTLTATNNININALMSASGSAALTTTGKLNMGMNSGGFIGKIDYASTGALTMNGNAYTVISTKADLQNMTLSGKYALGSNVDLAGAWTPIGNATTQFTGMFDGFGHTMSNLTINSTGVANVGLFGYTNGASLRNIGLVGGSVVSNDNFVGGLVGYNNASTISNSYNTGTVTGLILVGGLVGYNYSNSIISNSYATGNITSTNNANSNTGGLVGYNRDSTVTNSYSTGNVSGYNTVGGLVGYNGDTGTNTTISYSYATGAVNGNQYVGGLVGQNSSSGYNSFINNSYATGSVNGVADVGGLVGYLYQSQATNTYSTGAVTGTSNVGGLVGRSVGSATNSFWDTQTSGQSTSTAGTGKTTAQMKDIATFSTWGVNIVGDASFSDSTPKLRWATSGLSAGTSIWVIGQPSTSVTYTLAPLSGTYTYTSNPYVLSNLWTSTTIFGGLYNGWIAGTDYSFSTASYTNAGTYSNISINVLKSGFAAAINGNTTGSLTIAKADLAISGLSASNKIYDGTSVATLTGTASVTPLGSDTVTLGGTASGTFANSSIGTNKAVTVTGITTANTNYNLIQQTNLSANITAAGPTAEEIAASIEAARILAQQTAAVSTQATVAQQVSSTPNEFINKKFVTEALTPPSAQNSNANNSPTLSSFEKLLSLKYGEGAAVSSTVTVGTPTEIITLSELQTISTGQSQINNGDSATAPANIETRVALAKNSMVSLVNGGVSLPKGVDQQFYIAKPITQKN